MSNVYFYSYFREKAFLGKPATIPLGENKDVSWIKFRLLYDNSFCARPCGYHPPSRVPICSFPASKRDDNPLRTMRRSHPQCVWFKVQQPSLCVTEPPQTLFDATTCLFGEEKCEKEAAPLTLQSRCEEDKMRVLIGLQVHGILQTQQKSQLSLLNPSLWITRLNLASLVSGCTIRHSTTLKWLTMVSNLAHPQL